MNKIKVGLILSLAITIVGCDSKGGTSSVETVMRCGEIARSEISLTSRGSSIGFAYLGKRMVEVRLEREAKPGRIALLTEEFREATRKWEEEVQAFKKEKETIWALCVENTKWSEKDKVVFRSYKEKALAACKSADVKCYSQTEVVDNFISSIRYENQDIVAKHKKALEDIAKIWSSAP